jgi:hypothetical protein
MKIINLIKTLARILAVVFIFVFIYSSIFKKDHDRNPEQINPNIYYAFQQIHQGCRSIAVSRRARDCRVVVDIFERCKRGELLCTVSEYYQFLSDLGYELPPFYKDD